MTAQRIKSQGFLLLATVMLITTGMARLPVRTGQAAALAAVSLQPVAAGFSTPTLITHAGDGSGRLFIVQQSGEISVVLGGTRLPAPFLNLSAKITCCGERGLLSIAFSPDYPTRPYFYVDYTDLNGNTVVSRFSAASGSNTADPASEVIILQVVQPYANHNGGQIAIGPDGYLYIGMGDGGDSGDPQGRAQNPGELLGKILRIDVETPGCVVPSPGQAANYCIPTSNPYRLSPGYRPEIWALGLRNPWRFSFDRANGDLYIGDVGQGMIEEVDYQPVSSPGGQNYGWNILEGNLCSNPPNGCMAPAGYSAPVHTYPHAGGNCSISGGYVYRGPLFPNLQGIYIFADYCTGEIWGLDPATAWQSQLLLDAPFFITTFGEDEAGFLYTADYFGGTLYRLVSSDPGPNARYFPLIFR